MERHEGVQARPYRRPAADRGVWSWLRLGGVGTGDGAASGGRGEAAARPRRRARAYPRSARQPLQRQLRRRAASTGRRQGAADAGTRSRPGGEEARGGRLPVGGAGARAGRAAPRRPAGSEREQPGERGAEIDPDRYFKIVAVTSTVILRSEAGSAACDTMTVLPDSKIRPRRSLMDAMPGSISSATPAVFGKYSSPNVTRTLLGSLYRIAGRASTL